MSDLNPDIKSLVTGYMERAALLRSRFNPDATKAKDLKEFRALFVDSTEENFNLIAENDKFIEERILPLLSPDYVLNKEDKEFLGCFVSELMSSSGMEYTDPVLFYNITNKLYKDAISKKDINERVFQLFNRFMACIGIIIFFECVSDIDFTWKEYYQKGVEAAEELLALLEKEEFDKVTDSEAKGIIVLMSRYFCNLYEFAEHDFESIERVIDLLVHSYEIAEDPYYVAALPQYEWFKHKMKCLEYLAHLLDRNNEGGMTPEQCKHIHSYVSKLDDYYWEDPEMAEAAFSRFRIDWLLANSRYRAGIINYDEYQRTLVALYNDRGIQDDPIYGVMANFQLPNEIIGGINSEKLSESDLGDLENIYRSVIDDVIKIPNKEEVLASLGYIWRFMDCYIEVPGLTSFSDFSINFFSAIYPRAYVHFLSVAELTRSICGHFITHRPELFLGVLDCNTVNAVIEKRNEICAFAYNAAKMHDIGKIAYLPMRLVTERTPFPQEKQVVFNAREMSRKICERKISTNPYLNIMYGMGRDYNDTTEDENGFNPWKVKEKVIIDIVKIANDLDKMIESYERQGHEISLDIIVPVIKANIGTKYAPYMENLFTINEIYEDLEYILKEGREDIYRRTYVMLKEFQDRGLS